MDKGETEMTDKLEMDQEDKAIFVGCCLICFGIIGYLVM